VWVHDIDPIALAIGPLKIHWYGLMYLIGFACAWWLGVIRARKPGSGWNENQISDMIFWGAMGVVLGGRAGYVLFYNFDKFLTDPLWLFAVWEGGMSFHGGLLGVIIVLYWFGKQHDKTLMEMGDFVAPLIPIGLGAGRVGNFIGGELWGRTTDVSWGVIFPRAGDLPRHPSQLYEFVLEGVVLFVVLWWFSSKPRPRMAVSGLFLMLYGTFRSFVEFYREPDAHIEFVAFNWLTMGQVLSLPMIILGGFLLFCASRKRA
jgi:phosphatidylglycerol:prolipoprotein diacylglycerol transferase